MLLDRGDTVVVRFRHGLEEVARADIKHAAASVGGVVPLPGVLRVMAECIRSVNDAWGVFSRSRIDLLPHQLWVCRRVNAHWPMRWLVADDVGLGKTIEAGLILWPLVSRGTVRRLLILCPAALVGQWQQRLREMFDLRCAIYASEQDTPAGDFWGTHPFVVASLETLRLDRQSRRERMLAADPWDLLIVDEAHRLNADEDQGPTLGHRLVQELRDAGRIESMVFFTGTPHRGKDFGFLSLLQLLRPESFDPRQPLGPQLRRLRSVMIRNNKQDVTDLDGNRLFHTPRVDPATYAYSTEEAAFYETLTAFIASGKAYANRLGEADGRAVMLVLIAMQKLASSSVAAIVAALRKRSEGIARGRGELEALRARRSAGSFSSAILAEAVASEQDAADADVLAALEERIGELDARLRLVEDEEPRLRKLLDLAANIGRETKIERILGELEPDGRFEGRSVLIFTEYKATQALLLSRLQEAFGDNCVAFINGEDRLAAVRGADGRVRAMRSRRNEAARRFNAGEVRFLVATEAGGEGIDLQERCHSLIHADLPWNPMRLHQRVGRLNRYGQTRPVEVLTLRNPDTVESRIWDHLHAKLARIQKAYAGSMDEPEDAMQLVLGMASPTLFRELFADAPGEHSRLADWFDAKTGNLGGEDAIDTVKQIVGHADRFDFGRAASGLPRVDLEDLRPFLQAMLAAKKRRVDVGEDGAISFVTPDDWSQEFGIRKRYSDLSFRRDAPSAAVAGAGHKLFDRALHEALQHAAGKVPVPAAGIDRRIHVVRLQDRVTTCASRPVVLGVVEEPAEPRILLDWELLLLLNEALFPPARKLLPASWSQAVPQSPEVETFDAAGWIIGRADDLAADFKAPEAQRIAILEPIG